MLCGITDEQPSHVNFYVVNWTLIRKILYNLLITFYITIWVEHWHLQLTGTKRFQTIW
jgi:hypothetical protein